MSIASLVEKERPVAPASNGSVRVEIYDQSYHLRGSDAEYIQRVAEYVDMKMRAVAEQTRTVDSLRLAVLAALNIADEFFVLKKKYDGVATDVTRRASDLSGALDEILAESRRIG
jgi:cell division protein ZapA